MKYLKMLVFAIVIVVVVVGALLFFSRGASAPVATPLPSSSAAVSVSPTSAPVSIDGWKTVTDAKTGVTLQYPETLNLSYVTPVDWPPKVQVLSQALTCTAAGSPIAPGGQTRQQIMNGHTYCITETSEGAAGSTYRQYAYAFAKNYKVVILTFSLQFVQCGNFDQPQRAACDQQQGSFDVTGTADRIAQTVIGVED